VTKVAKDWGEIEAAARQMVADYGPRAPIAAAERLNECLDRGDRYGRDDWVQVVYVIHRLQQGVHPMSGW
jgi:hypothetical protein